MKTTFPVSLKRCSSYYYSRLYPKDFVVARVECFSCFRLVMSNEDIFAISKPVWFHYRGAPPCHDPLTSVPLGDHKQQDWHVGHRANCLSRRSLQLPGQYAESANQSINRSNMVKYEATRRLTSVKLELYTPNARLAS